MKNLILLALALAVLKPVTVTAQEIELSDHQTLYESGRPFGVFLDDAEQRRQRWLDNFEKGMVPEDLLEKAQNIGGTWFLLAVAVDGCSDSVNTIPFLAHLVNAVEGFEMRIVLPEPGKHIMEAHLTPDGRPSTPTVLVLNENYEEVGAFIERPEALQAWALGEGKELDSAAFLEAKFAWYDDDLGRQTMQAVLDIIEAASRR